MSNSIRVLYTIEDSESVYRFQKVWHPELMAFVSRYLNMPINSTTSTIRLTESEYRSVTGLLGTLGYRFEAVKTAKSNYRKGE